MMTSRLKTGEDGHGREGQAVEKSDLFSVKLESRPHLPPAQPTAESITTCQGETKAMQHNKGTTSGFSWAGLCAQM